MKTDLSGKWKYTEDYGYGLIEGELMLKQEGALLSGRIIFTDCSGPDDEFMIQEFLTGEIEGLKVRIKAVEADVIHSDSPVNYELDSWFGILVDEDTIKGVSQDEQGIEGSFVFERMEAR